MSNCYFCRLGEIETGNITVTLERNEAVVVIKHVPALVCDTCGEGYLDEASSRQVGEIADRAIENGLKIQLLEFAA